MESESIRAQIVGLEPGERRTWPLGIVRIQTLRQYASELGLELERRYSTNLSSDRRTISVIRHS